MKYLFSIYMTLIFISMSTDVYAGGVCMTSLGPCESELTGGLIKASTLINTAANVAVKIEEIVLDPIADLSLIPLAQEMLTNNIVSWANGGFGGTNPLIITNPERYVKEEGLRRVKANLGYIPKDSIFGDSIFSAIYNDQKDISSKTMLELLSKSDLPSIIQKNTCNENTLLSLAKNEAGGGTQADIQAAYDNLSSQLCEGDPSTDKALEQKLLAANDQNPSLGGWDAWLSLTGGENQYTKAVKGINVVKEERAVEKENDILDMGGLNPIGDKECVERAPLDPEGNAYDNPEDAPCIDEATLTPSATVEEALGDAATARLNKIGNIQGWQSLSSILTGFATSYLMKGLNTAFTTSGSSALNRPTTLASITATTSDLATSPERKEAITSPMLEIFTNYSDTLSQLATIDSRYLADTNAYRSQVEGVRACFTALKNDYPSVTADGRVTAANNFYSNRMQTINQITSSLNQEIVTIAPAQNLVNQTKAKITASNSSQEISNIFSDYMTQLEGNNYPTVGSEASREAEYTSSKAQADNDSEIKNHMSACAAIRNEYEQ
jgi:hypothetical protein